ncbi:hypothetical protein VNI00_009390 [Paramarasmius palmivorus]|uniref:F-box domain-containing protein n=1 Tax=Paramarasmius palmivorus TaxID=297713 RepID=A0AAW0CU02_9AGAR
MTEASHRLLPQELVDRIVDEHSQDIKELKTISLTSKAFLIASRRHIFSHLVIRSFYIPAFIEVFKHNLATTNTLSIHTLTLRSAFFAQMSMFSGKGSTLRGLLGGVTTLELQDITQRSWCPTPEAFFRVFPSIKNLRLVRVSFYDLPQFHTIISNSALTGLASMSWDAGDDADPYFTTSLLPFRDTPDAPSNLTSLSINAECLCLAFVHYIQTHHPHINDWRISGILSFNLFLVGELFQHAGAEAQRWHLCLEPGTFEIEALRYRSAFIDPIRVEMANAVNMERNSNVKAITLEGEMWWLAIEEIFHRIVCLSEPPLLDTRAVGLSWIGLRTADLARIVAREVLGEERMALRSECDKLLDELKVTTVHVLIAVKLRTSVNTRKQTKNPPIRRGTAEWKYVQESYEEIQDVFVKAKERGALVTSVHGEQFDLDA